MRAQGRRIGALVAVVVTVIVAVAPAVAERGDDSERLSKNGEVERTIDGVEVRLEFGRPKVRGREIWGGLVPYGEIWRTGADEATTFEVSDDVLVEGEHLPAGTYALFTIPGEKEWTVIFNEEAEQWGAFAHDPSKDVLRIEVEPRAAEHVEAMDFRIEPPEVVLRWERLAVPFSIEGVEAAAESSSSTSRAQ